MAYDPEAAFVALFARIQQATTFKTVSRRFKTWDETPPAECPAMFLAMAPQVPQVQQNPALPPLWLVGATLVLYVRNDADPKGAPATVLNPLIAAVVNLLKMQPGETPAGPFVGRPAGQYATTLGGLCAWCRVSGAIEPWEGTIDNGMGALIPLEMLLSS